jgi:hypothetical protein
MKHKEPIKTAQEKSNLSKNREMAANIIDKFEDLLDDKDITIPSADRESNEDEARIYGTEYYELENAITELLGGDK